MRFMCTPATFVASCVFARVTTCRGLHQRRFRALLGSPLLRTYRALSYGTHDPFPLTITPLLSSRLAHTSSVNPPLDRPRRWERHTRSLLSFPTMNTGKFQHVGLLYALRSLTHIGCLYANSVSVSNSALSFNSQLSAIKLMNIRQKCNHKGRYRANSLDVFLIRWSIQRDRIFDLLQIITCNMHMKQLLVCIKYFA